MTARMHELQRQKRRPPLSLRRRAGVVSRRPAGSRGLAHISHLTTHRHDAPSRSQLP